MVTAVDIRVEEKISKVTDTLIAHIMSPRIIIAEVIIVSTNNFQGFQIKLLSRVN